MMSSLIWASVRACCCFWEGVGVFGEEEEASPFDVLVPLFAPDVVEHSRTGWANATHAQVCVILFIPFGLCHKGGGKGNSRCCLFGH